MWEISICISEINLNYVNDLSKDQSSTVNTTKTYARNQIIINLCEKFLVVTFGFPFIIIY